MSTSDASHTRRAFIARAAALAAGATLFSRNSAPRALGSSRAVSPHADSESDDAATPFQISLAQWSLNRAIDGRTLDPLDFATIARRDFDIDAIEYVNQFYRGRTADGEYLKQLRKRADDSGVTSVLIMCDGEGRLGDPDDAARAKAIDNHRPWLEWASALGCHAIRVNAASSGNADEQKRLAADGLSRLTEIAAQSQLNVIVENHGGLSSNGAWLAGVIKAVNHPRCGTLPDFGNFRMFRKADGSYDEYDRYLGMSELMPFAKGVSAKSYDFNAQGGETTIDYARMLKIVFDAGYRQRIGIEYEGDRLSEPDGIRATKALLERVRGELQARANPSTPPPNPPPNVVPSTRPESH